METQITEGNAQEMVNLYNAGTTMLDIAFKFRTNVPTVRAKLIERAVVIRPRGRRKNGASS